MRAVHAADKDADSQMMSARQSAEMRERARAIRAMMMIRDVAAMSYARERERYDGRVVCYDTPSVVYDDEELKSERERLMSDAAMMSLLRRADD